MEFPFVPVHRFLENSADRSPDSLALVHGKNSWTYAEIEEKANRLANLLIKNGVLPGNRVALLADNGIEAVSGLFGILKAGACAVALSGANKPHTNSALMADSGCVGIVTRALQVRNDFEKLVADLPDLRFAVLDRVSPKWELPDNLVVLLESELNAAANSRPDLSVTEENLCMILYTSGSTGKPRGVTLTHRNLSANTHQILEYLQLTADDSILTVLPFHYSFGNSLLLTHFAVGGHLVVDNRFAYPAPVLDAMCEQKVTGFSGVPSTYAILCAKTDFLQRSMPHLRYLTQAGGGMAPALVRRIREAFKDRARVFIMYGQTEASARLSYVPPERLEEKTGSIGIGIPGVLLTVRRGDGTECNIDEVGEVVADGDNIMSGYWNDPEETALVLKDGLLYTGDLGRKDSDGYIFLVDRIKNMIKAGANRVSSKEVEDTICELEGIVEACVVGQPDEILGEAIVAHVVVADGLLGSVGDEGGADCADGADNFLDEKRILSFLRDRLASYKMPREIHFHKALPKNSSGKIRKSELKKMG